MDHMPVHISMHPKETILVYEKISTFKVQLMTPRDTLWPWLSLCLVTNYLSLLFSKARDQERLKKRTARVWKRPVYVCQDNPCMNRDLMWLWVNLVLKPYEQTAPSNVWPKHHCNMLGDVVSKTQKLEVVVQHIQGGCTSYCQPVDLGFNKPFKSYL